MKRTHFNHYGLLAGAMTLLLVLVCAAALADVPINETTFPDDSFRDYVKENCDTNGDNILSNSEISATTEIRVSERSISDLTGIEHFTGLQELWCGSNQLTSLDLSQNTALQALYCYGNKLTKLDLSKNTALEKFNCGENQLTSLNVDNNRKLTYIGCENNLLTNVDISQNTEMTEFRCYGNQLTKLDISSNTKLEILRCNNNQLTELNISKCPYLKKLVETTDRETWAEDSGVYIWRIPYEENPSISDYELRVDKTVRVITASGDPPAGAVVINETNFPDDVFRSYVADQFDTDGDGYLSQEELSAATEIRVSEKNISDLKGISYFKALKELWCGSNQLTSLDLSQNTALQALYCYGNKLTKLDLSKNTALESFNCGENQLTSLNVSKNKALTYIGCENNQLKTIDVSQNTKLTEFRCYGNQLTKLDISKNTKLEILLCEGNKLTKLDISKCPPLKKLVKTAEKETWEKDSNVYIWRIEDPDYPGIYDYELRIDKKTELITDSSESYDLKNGKIAAIKAQVYTGKAIQPSVTVTYQGKTLKKGTDYTVAFKNNVNVGKATVTVTGKGKYTGTKTASFVINPKAVKLSSLKAGSKQLTVKWEKGSGIDGYEVEYSLKENFSGSKKVTVSKASETKTVIKKLKSKKVYYVRVRTWKKAGGKKYYSAWSNVKNAKTK